MNRYLFYPGCSMESSAKAYMESLNTILEPLELTFEEIDDWNCCGATEYLGINLIPAYSLIARNLARGCVMSFICGSPDFPDQSRPSVALCNRRDRHSGA